MIQDVCMDSLAFQEDLLPPAASKQQLHPDQTAGRCRPDLKYPGEVGSKQVS